jgi:outer membrane protein insertion porin family
MRSLCLAASFALLVCSALCFAQEPDKTAAPPAAPAAPSTPSTPPALAAPERSGDSNFTVGDIRIEGLQRISEGTVYNYLPVNIGDKLTSVRVREAVRALYNTGFFRDVQVRRDGNTLVIVVLERPSIESFEITGNKDIKTEDLQKSLRNVGLATGKTFDRSVLEDVKGYLTDQYFSRGKYAIRIDEKVEEQPGNRVKVKIDIKEGKRAKIREINVVGNERYTDKQIVTDFELHTPNWLSWYKQDDRYSSESLQGDLEKLRSFYMDRGYANFQIMSTQVAIAPEKDDIFITVNIEEGKVFKLTDVKLAGTFVVPEPELARLLLVHPGEIYSRKGITATQTLIQNRLGQDGYAFAKVDPVPTPDNVNNTVGITFFVDPGNRVYVRNIMFSGVTKVNDEVLRREMRQLEGGWLSNTALERSKQRIQRLPYVKKVDSETTPVPGSPDQVDVEYKIEEGPGAQLSGGIGYSETYKFTLNGNYTDANFVGTGERISVNLEGGIYNKVYSIAQTNPYSTIDNLVRTISFTFRDVSQFTSASSQFSTKIFTTGVSYSYPITEYQFVSLGANVNYDQLVVVQGSSAIQAEDWVKENGSPYHSVLTGLIYDPTTASYITSPAVDVFGTKFATGQLVAGWSYDSRNKSIFADKGMRQTLSVSSTVPVGSVRYWKANYEFIKYVPLWGQWRLSTNALFGYGAAMGSTTALPPFEDFYGGGPDSVRGYRESRLGPKDQFGNPYGGNMNVLGRLELIPPMPEKFASAARVSFFFDIGNVFNTSSNKVQFYAPPIGTSTGTAAIGALGPPIDYRFSYDNLKRSVGVAVQWLAPLGLFRFSLGFPLNATPERDGVSWGDETERFQFSIGQAF